MHVHYDDDVVQVVTMDVLTGGHETSFKSVRLQNKNCITYIQPEPPPALNVHRGSWEFVSTSTGTCVTCRHEIEVNSDSALKFLSAANITVAEGRVEEVMQEVIKTNSLQTIQALRESLESQRSNGHVAENHQMA
jgi:hypothetical protein